MGIEELKRWHWAVLGGIMGIALAYAWVSTADSTDGMQSTAASEFERDIIFQDDASKLPLISGIVVHPAQYSPPKRANVNLVTYKRLGRTNDGVYGWKDKYFIAGIPYVPAVRRNITTDSSTTVQSYLTELGKQYKTVQFRYGWWMVPRNAVLLGGSTGVLLMGGIWPILLNLMFGAGLGRKADDGVGVGGAFSLWRYKPRERASTSRPRPVVTVADQQRLEQVANAYERQMHASAVAGVASSPAASQKAAPEVQKLSSQALEAVKTEQDEDEIELKNREYYPVIVHHAKHHEGAPKPDGKKPG